MPACCRGVYNCNRKERIFVAELSGIICIPERREEGKGN